jgi:hypothetical protein
MENWIDIGSADELSATALKRVTSAHLIRSPRRRERYMEHLLCTGLFVAASGQLMVSRSAPPNCSMNARAIAKSEKHQR